MLVLQCPQFRRAITSKERPLFRIPSQAKQNREIQVQGKQTKARDLQQHAAFGQFHGRILHRQRLQRGRSKLRQSSSLLRIQLRHPSAPRGELRLNQQVLDRRLKLQSPRNRGVFVQIVNWVLKFTPYCEKSLVVTSQQSSTVTQTLYFQTSKIHKSNSQAPCRANVQNLATNLCIQSY